MINSKLVTRKRSENLIHHKQSEPDLKRKKSTSNLLPPSKPKKEQKPDQQFKKPKEQKKLVHSTSKGKLNRKHLKSEKNDQNFNSLNHKKSVKKIQYASKTSKDLKTKRVSEELMPERKQEKTRHLVTEHTLTKVNSQARLHVKKLIKKKHQTKYHDDEKQHQKEKIPSKTLQKNPTSKKLLVTKSKLKHPSSSSIHTQSQSNQRKSTQKKVKINKNKISEIIQKSILYSDVNYEFKEQISLLGSGIKKEEDFFIPYPFHSYQSEFMDSKETHERKRIEHNAAVMIQKHFRGYIQRKYISDARYIIDCIKKIQRFWRKCMEKKREAKKFEMVKTIETIRGETSTSLITIKDFNDTCRLEKRQIAQNQEFEDRAKNTHHENQTNKDSLKEIIKNLLSEENLNQSIKDKIRTVMGNENAKKEQIPQKKPLTKALSLKPITELSLENDCPLENSKQFYVKKKINMEITSERCFNSPMNSSSQFLTSPAVKKLTSPKCLSSSFSKEVKGNYNNYFKSNKNAIYCSPSKNEENTDRKSLRSHSGSKRERENYIQLSSKEAVTKELTSMPFETQKEFPSQITKPTHTKQEYLFNADICAGSPIAQCKDQSIEEINLLSTQKIELQTRRTPKPFAIKPFPTEFAFIEEFCLLITDYLRDDEDMIEVFLQKVKGLKYYKIEKIFKEWEQWEFEQLSSENEPLKRSILKSSVERPIIFSKLEKKLLIEYPSLRLFLNQNDYSDNEIFNQTSAQSAYIKFIFDVFEECIFKKFSQVTVRDLKLVTFRETRRDFGYLSIVLSQAMGNMLKSAQILCGSFETEDMTEVQKEERKMMNMMREDEDLKEFREEPFDTYMCEMWINLLISKLVMDELVQETAFTLQNQLRK